MLYDNTNIGFNRTDFKIHRRPSMDENTTPLTPGPVRSRCRAVFPSVFLFPSHLLSSIPLLEHYSYIYYS